MHVAIFFDNFVADAWEQDHNLLAQMHEDFLSKNQLREDLPPTTHKRGELDDGVEATAEHDFEDTEDAEEEAFFSFSSRGRNAPSTRDVLGFSMDDDMLSSSTQSLGAPMDELESMFSKVLADDTDTDFEVRHCFLVQ